MSKFFINRPIFAIVISIILVALGAITMIGLPIEQYPNITPPMVSVSASYVGADASVVDKSVATPIGQNVMGVSNMLYMSSTSGNDGSMNLSVTFDIDSDPDMNTILTQNKVSSALALLPESVKNQGVTTQKSQSNFLMVLSLYSDGRYDSQFLSNYAYINIRNELLKINGVGNIQVLGAGQYSMRVWVKPDMLSYLKMSVGDVVTAIETQSGVYPLGHLGASPIKEPTPFTYTVVTESPINTQQQYENIVLRTTESGSQVLLKDVARVELGSQIYGVSSTFDNKPSTTLVINQSPGSNAVEVGKEMLAQMEILKQKFPQGVDYEPLVDATSVITDGVNEIIYTLIFVVLLVMVIVFIFIQNKRATLIPLIAVPVSLVGTFIFFPMLGLSLNIFSLLAIVLAVGLVVDDAIVVVEASQLNIDNGMTPYDATIEAMKKVSPAIIGTTVVLIAVFVPLAKLSGITGRLFTQFSTTIAISFVISAFNALSLSPALCAMLLRKEEPKTKGFFKIFNKLFGKQKTGYINFATKLANFPKRAVLGIAVAIIVMALGFRLVPSGFLPEEDDGYVMMAINLPDAASLERTEEICAQLDSIVRSYEFTNGTISVAGYNFMSSIVSSSSGIIFISLKDWGDRNMSSFEIADLLNEELYVKINNAETYTFGPPAIPGLGVSSGFTIELLDNGGNTPQYMQKYAEEFMAAALKRPEIASINNQFTTNMPQKSITIDEQAALKAGVNLNDLHNTLSTYLGGAYVNNFNRFGQLYQTYVEADSEYRRDANALQNFFIMNNNGESIPVSSLATIRDTSGVQYITRYNLLPSIALTGAAGSKYSTGQVITALEEVAKEVLPPDMSYQWGDMTYQEVTNSSSSLPIFIFIVMFVYLILAALYENWAVPLTVILGIPFAMLGSLAIVYLVHFFNPVFVNNVYFQISLVVLMALSAKNAILIIEYANTSHLNGMEAKEAGIDALAARYRPIIMTSLAFMLGAAPLIFASGPYSIARNVIGVAMFGGMILTTYLAISFYPSLYKMISRFVKPLKTKS